jgi:hypothetical protein
MGRRGYPLRRRRALVGAKLRTFVLRTPVPVSSGAPLDVACEDTLASPQRSPTARLTARDAVPCVQCPRVSPARTSRHHRAPLYARRRWREAKRLSDRHRDSQWTYPDPTDLHGGKEGEGVRAGRRARVARNRLGAHSRARAASGLTGSQRVSELAVPSRHPHPTDHGQRCRPKATPSRIRD